MPARSLPTTSEENGETPTETDRGLPLPGHDMADPTARDLMETDVATVSPDDDVASVLTKLSRASFEAFPVVDETNRVVGIVTRTDLVKIFQPSDRVFWIPVGLPPFTEVIDYAFDLSWDDIDVEIDLARRAGDPVSSVMTENVITVNPDDDLDHVLALLADEELDINHLPVTEGGKLVGMIARQDVLAALRDEREAVRKGERD